MKKPSVMTRANQGKAVISHIIQGSDPVFNVPAIGRRVIAALKATRLLLAYDWRVEDGKPDPAHVRSFRAYFLSDALVLGAQVEEAAKVCEVMRVQSAYSELRDLIGVFHDLYGPDGWEWQDWPDIPARLPEWGSA